MRVWRCACRTTVRSAFPVAPAGGVAGKRDIEGKKYQANLNATRHEAKVVPFFRKYRSLAAGLAILIISGFIIQTFINQGSDPFSNHFEEYPMYLKTRSGNDVKADLVDTTTQLVRKNSTGCIHISTMGIRHPKCRSVFSALLPLNYHRTTPQSYITRHNTSIKQPMKG